MERSSRYALFCAVVASLGGLLFGFTTGVIAGVLHALKVQFALSTFQEGVAVSIILLGALLGACVGGTLADRWGRKISMIVTAFFFLLGTALVAGSTDFTLFLFGRLVTGIGVGLSSLICPLYLAEIAPASSRGGIVAMNQLAITVGILCAYLVNHHYAAEAAWQTMFAAAFFPAILFLVGIFFIEESPHWLLGRGAKERAHAIWKKLLRSEKAPEHKIPTASPGKLSWKELFKPHLKRAFLIGIALSVFQQITGVNTIFYYAPKIFDSAHFSSESSSTLATVGIGVVNVFATLFALWLLNRVGRRTLLFWGLGGMGLFLLCLSIGFFTETLAMERVALISLMGYVVFFAIGIGPVAWVILSEIYPTRIRGRAMSLGVAANWLANYAVALTFPDLVSGLGIGLTFTLYALFCALAIWFISRFVPETRGKTLEEIERII